MIHVYTQVTLQSRRIQCLFRNANGEKLPESETEMMVAQENDPRIREIAGKV